MFLIVERSYGVVEKFPRLGWHAVSIIFMYILVFTNQYGI